MTCNMQPQPRGLHCSERLTAEHLLAVPHRAGQPFEALLSRGGKGTGEHGTVCMWMKGHLSSKDTDI